MDTKEAVCKIADAINATRINRGHISSITGGISLENEVDEMLPSISTSIKEWLPELKEFKPKLLWDVYEDIEDLVIKDAYLYTCLIGFEKEQEILGDKRILELLEKYDNENIDEYDFDCATDEIFWTLYSKANEYVKDMPYEWVDVFVRSVNKWKWRVDNILCDSFFLEPLYFMIGFQYVMGEYFKELDSYNSISPNTATNPKLTSPFDGGFHLFDDDVHINEELKPNMSPRELENREKRLRRAAAKKGLFIKKRKWRLYNSSNSYDSFDGYCVGTVETGLIIWGENEVGINAPTLEEAEEIVANY